MPSLYLDERSHMLNHDWNRPYTSHEKMAIFQAIDVEAANLYGKKIKAMELSNVDYKIRFGKLRTTISMRNPPGTGRIFPGYLVVRKIGTPNQYETWMPEHVFDDLYEACP
jgi:hypothetical protein